MLVLARDFVLSYSFDTMQKLNIEVFRDSNCPDVDPTPHLESIENMGALATHVTLRSEVRDEALPDGPIGIGNWVEMPTDADIAVVLTGRTLGENGDATVAGRCLGSPDRLKNTILVAYPDHPSAPTTTRHEVAHAFGLVLKEQGVNAHDASHCDDYNCVMHAVLNEKHHPHPDRQKFGRRVLEKLHFAEPLPDLVTYNDTFCGQCDEDLERLAAIRRYVANSGNMQIPKSWLPYRK